MNLTFMEEFYDRFYEDPMRAAVSHSPEAWWLSKRIQELEHEFMDRIGGFDSDNWREYDHIDDLRSQYITLVCKAAYLLGTQDRDRMLE